MGYNSVAVLLNDMSHEIENSADFGKRLAFAMNNWSPIDGNKSCGPHHTRIISRDHSSGFQIVCVHGNTGWRVDNSLYDNLFSGIGAWHAFQQMADCLKRHGYTVKPPKNPRKEN